MGISTSITPIKANDSRLRSAPAYVLEHIAMDLYREMAFIAEAAQELYNVVPPTAYYIRTGRFGAAWNYGVKPTSSGGFQGLLYNDVTDAGSAGDQIRRTLKGGQTAVYVRKRPAHSTPKHYAQFVMGNVNQAPAHQGRWPTIGKFVESLGSRERMIRNAREHLIAAVY